MLLTEAKFFIISCISGSFGSNPGGKPPAGGIIPGIYLDGKPGTIPAFTYLAFLAKENIGYL